ncbi:MAG: hypothetical protein ACYDHY_05325 [Acidiferrobacterales bacterium]
MNDLTCVPTREDWLYLAVIIAIQTRQVLGYSLAERMPDEPGLNALRNACHLEVPAEGTVFHSDSNNTQVNTPAKSSTPWAHCRGRTA